MNKSNKIIFNIDIIPFLILFFASCFNIFLYHYEITLKAPDMNDHLYHFTMISQMNEAWERGENPLDPWIPFWGQGFPVLRYYQNLPHILVVSIYHLFQKTIPLYEIFKEFAFLSLVFLPLSFFWGTKLLGFNNLTSSFIALLVTLLHTSPERYFIGFQSHTFIWIGMGLFSQVVGMVFFAPAIGLVYNSIMKGKQFGLAILFLSCLWLSHILLGYMASIVCLIFLLFNKGFQKRKKIIIFRLIFIYSVTFIATSYILIPSWLESTLINKTIWEGIQYWDSFGFAKVISSLFLGKILDGNRIPIITLLSFTGIIAIIIKWYFKKNSPSKVELFSILSFLLGLILFFGRAGWGELINILPFSQKLPFHRFICLVQYSGLLLAGIGLNELWKLIHFDKSIKQLLISISVTIILLIPPFIDIYKLASISFQYKKFAKEEFNKNGKGIEEVFKTFMEMNKNNPGRGYAGASWDWGENYKLGNIPIYLFWTYYKIPSISYMMHGMSLNTDLEVYFDPKRLDHYNLFNIRYLISYNKELIPSFANTIATFPQVFGAVVPTRGYFDIVKTNWFFSYSESTQSDLKNLTKKFMESNWHDLRRFIRIGWEKGDKPKDEEIEITPYSKIDLPYNKNEVVLNGSVINESYENGIFKAIVDIKNPSYLLFRMTFHPNWLALVDGNFVKTVMLSPSYIGVPLQAGKHEIKLKYKPPLWTFLLFCVGLLSIILVFLRDYFYARPSKSTC